MRSSANRVRSTPKPSPSRCGWARNGPGRPTARTKKIAAQRAARGVVRTVVGRGHAGGSRKSLAGQMNADEHRWQSGVICCSSVFICGTMSFHGELHERVHEPGGVRQYPPIREGLLVVSRHARDSLPACWSRIWPGAKHRARAGGGLRHRLFFPSLAARTRAGPWCRWIIGGEGLRTPANWGCSGRCRATYARCPSAMAPSTWRFRWT